MRCKVAYVLHRFPYLSKVFILLEMYWIRKYGVELDVFSLLAPGLGPAHAQAGQQGLLEALCWFG